MKQMKRIAKLPLLVLGIILCQSAGLQAQEQRGDVIVVVEAKGDNATAAREMAVTKGQIEGFKLLVQRLAPDIAMTIISSTPESRMINAAKGFEVLNEQMDTNTYRAKMKVDYDVEMVSEIIRSPDAAAGGSLKSSVLVLPVLKMGSTLQLWEQGNSWRDIWNSVGLEVGRGIIVMPYGDQTDKDAVDAFTASSGAYERLMPLVARYGASQVVIAEAVPVTEGNNVALQVALREMSAQGGEASVENYSAQQDETQEMLMIRAARSIASAIKDRNTPGYSNTNSPGGKRVMLLASIRDMSQWLELRKRLLAMNVIEKIELKALSPRQVDVMVHYRGDASLLAKYMIAGDLAVTPGAEFWTVSLQ